MTDLTNITRVILADGYGRKYETINATEIHIMQDLGTMWIQHDGDTSHQIEGESYD